jgi:hypothetical protein
MWHIEAGEERVPRNFIGKTLREQPELMGSFSDRDAYIIFAHADDKNHKTHEELGEIFGITFQRAGQILHDGIKKIWEGSSPEIQSTYPLTTIYKAARRLTYGSPEMRTWRSAEQTRRLQDPERRAQLDAQLARVHETNKGAVRSPETSDRLRTAMLRRLEDPKARAQLDKMHEASRGRTYSPEAIARMGAGQRRRFQDLRERGLIEGMYDFRRGKKMSKKFKDHMRAVMIRRFEDPDERARIIEKVREANIGRKQPFKEKLRQRAGLRISRVKDPKERAKLLRAETRRRRDIETTEDFDLWEIAVSSNILGTAIQRGFLDSADVDVLSAYFNNGVGLIYLRPST